MSCSVKRSNKGSGLSLWAKNGSTAVWLSHHTECMSSSLLRRVSVKNCQRTRRGGCCFDQIPARQRGRRVQMKDLNFRWDGHSCRSNRCRTRMSDGHQEPDNRSQSESRSAPNRPTLMPLHCKTVVAFWFTTSRMRSPTIGTMQRSPRMIPSKVP